MENMTASSTKCDYTWLSQYCFRCVAKGSHMRICAHGDDFGEGRVAGLLRRAAGVRPAMAGLILRRARPRSPQCRSRLFGRRDASELRRLALEQATIDAAGSRGKRG